MNTRYAGFVFAFCCVTGLSVASGQVYIGITGGPNSMTLSGDAPDMAEYTSRIGFMLGAVGEFPLTADIQLSVQPTFVRRGAGVAFDVGLQDPVDSLDLALDYVSLPVMARFFSANRVWFVNGGFDLSFLLNASLTDVVKSTSTDVTASVNDIDLAMLLGVGAMIPLEPVMVTVELRYSQSILNAGANVGQVYGVPVRFRSSGLTLAAGVLLPL